MILFAFAISVLNSLLFYGKDFGINVILFMIPLLLGIYYFLSKENKIKNKKGLLFIIPILLISCSYFLYDNLFFQLFNMIVITGLIILMYIYTIKPTYQLDQFMISGLKLIFRPLDFISKYFKLVEDSISKIIKLNDTKKKYIKSIILVFPIVLIVLLLLSSADMIFGSIFENVFHLLDEISLDSLISRIIIITILFIYIGCVLYYLMNDYEEEEFKEKESKKIEVFTIKLLLTALNIIYIVFDVIQIKSLIFHNISMDISYAEYAREGFFQLMIISIINLTILLYSKKSEENKYNNVMSILMIGLTSIIIASSFLRMSMYESAYGYTLLRLLVYITLITEVILLIPTVVYILKPNTKILKYYLIIITTVYTVLAISPVDYFITYNNIQRYDKTGKIDVDYLQNNHTDNLPLLINLYQDNKDKEIKQSLKMYFDTFNGNYELLEWNLSKKIAKDELEKIK